MFDHFHIDCRFCTPQRHCERHDCTITGRAPYVHTGFEAGAL